MPALVLVGIYLSILVVAAWGWILNLKAIIALEPFVWSAKSIIAIIGVPVPPIGIIMGWFIW